MAYDDEDSCEDAALTHTTIAIRHESASVSGVCHGSAVVLCCECTWCGCPVVGVVLGACLLSHTSRQGRDPLQQDPLGSEHVPQAPNQQQGLLVQLAVVRRLVRQETHLCHNSTHTRQRATEIRRSKWMGVAVWPLSL